MNVDQTEIARAEVETILGRDVVVQYENPALPQEPVTVRKVSFRNMGRYANVVSQDEATEIALYTGNPPEWADSLTETSAEAILTVGRELNLKRFANFATRATKFDQMIRKAAPILGQLAEEARKALAASRSGAASNT